MKKEWYKSGPALLEEIGTSAPAPDELLVWYMGQCGFVYKKDVIVYIDPVFNDITSGDGSSCRLYPPPFDASAVQADYCICTHAHIDHMAIPTLIRMAASNLHTIFIVPEDCIPHMLEAGISRERIIEAKAGHRIRLPGLEIQPVSAAHPVHQKTASGGDVALCYQLHMGHIRLLHLGDTYMTDQLYHNLKMLKSPDLFFPPINGGDYFRTASDIIGNLSPREAAICACALKADMTIPTHYDMISGNTADPFDFVREIRELDSTRKWALPALGERIVYKKEA